MQNIGLVLDTSTERGVFAAFVEGVCLFEEHLPFGIQNSDLVLPALQRKLKDKLFSFKDLAFIGVGIGPGSYTGIRVGATLAKTLSFVFEIPLVGIGTLDTFIPEKEGVFAAVIDAKIGGVYAQIGCLRNGEVNILTPAESFSLQEAVERLQSIPILVSPNIEKIRPKLEHLNPQNNWEWQECDPSGEQLYRVAQKKIKSGLSCVNQHLELLYLRKTQAEIERENRLLP